jgi:ABC-type Co2+ transport system permease subunit
MHIPDGFLDPKTAAGLLAAGTALVATALGKVHEYVTSLGLEPVFAGTAKNIKSGIRLLSLDGKDFISKIFFMSALLFAAQMFNFPINQGTSGHLLGGVLAVLFLGPWGGTVALSMVLVIQSLFYADGGILALGANIINMSGSGCLLGYALLHSLQKIIPRPVAIIIAAWLSVIIAATLCAFELALSGAYPLVATLSAMLKSHLVIGLGEALLTLLGYTALTKAFDWTSYDE